jgi:hypothetical protein
LEEAVFVLPLLHEVNVTPAMSNAGIIIVRVIILRGIVVQILI